MNFEEIYLDQAVKQTSMFDRRITSFYTPEGIRRMDTQFSKRIMAFKRGESYTKYNWRGEVDWVYKDTLDGLKREIEECPHLHSTIKENLLFNLTNS